MSTLFDQLLRHQIYLEGLKEGEIARINRKMLKELEKIVAKELKKLPFDRLDGLTATGRNKLIQRINRAQREALIAWRSELMSSLREYAKTDATLISRVFRKAGKSKIAKPTLAQVWEDVAKEPVGGPKSTVRKMIDDMAKAQINAVKGTIKSAYSTGKTRDELYDDLRGTKEKGYGDGVFRKFRNQSRAVGSTAFQHAKGRVHSAVASENFSRYRWVSVIDSATSDICRSRNGKVYTYGDGPVPPAHFHCRSSIVPVDRGIEEPGDIDPPFFEWVQEQPEEFIRDIFPQRKAEQLIRGTAKREDFPRFEGIGPLTLDQFKSKADIIGL